MQLCPDHSRLLERQAAPVLTRQQPRRQSRSQLRATKQKSAQQAAEEGFKWDPSNARWKRVKAEKNAEGKFSTDNWEKGGVAEIKTRTGGAYTVWPVIHAKLTQRGLKSINDEEAYNLQQKGKAVLVDVRAKWNYEGERIEDAVSVPLFRGVEGKTAWDTLKRLVMTVGFAMKATERDPEFRQKAQQQLPKNKTLIVYCGLGGTLHVGAKPWAPGRKEFKDDPERAFGKESRSLKGCYELQEAGFKDVVHLEGGISQWRHDGFPTI